MSRTARHIMTAPDASDSWTYALDASCAHVKNFTAVLSALRLSRRVARRGDEAIVRAAVPRRARATREGSARSRGSVRVVRGDGAVARGRVDGPDRDRDRVGRSRRRASLGGEA